MDIIINGITAGVIAAFCLYAVVLSIMTIRCTSSPHWVHYWRIVAGLAVAFAFGYAFINGLRGGSGTVPFELGRPAIVLLTGSFAVSCYIDHVRGRC
jgi:hypothetical protein